MFSAIAERIELRFEGAASVAPVAPLGVDNDVVQLVERD